MAPKKDTATIHVQPGALKGQKCIITGEIDGQSRKSAEQILINAGATIEKSLNKKVTLAVMGENAGPNKVAKIEELGCESKDWDELIEEIKADGPPADAEEDDDDEDAEEEEEVEEKPKAQKGKAKANTKAKAEPVPKPKASASSSTFSLEGKHVIITGTIPGHDRKSAQAVVENAGAKVEKSVNKSLEIAIVGTNAGPDKLKKFEDQGVEIIQWSDLAEKLGFEAAPEKEVAKVDTSDAPDSIDGMTLLITGTIDGQTRTSAQKILETAGAKFAKSFNNEVELVVLGTNAGPDKLNKIAEKELPTCSFEALVDKLGLEVEPPKKKAKKS